MFHFCVSSELLCEAVFPIFLRIATISNHSAYCLEAWVAWSGDVPVIRDLSRSRLFLAKILQDNLVLSVGLSICT